MFKDTSFKLYTKLLLFVIIFSLGLGFSNRFLNNNQTKTSHIEEKNTPKAFISEVYDKIKENYWNNISDAELLDFFKLSIEKNGGQILASKFENKEKLLKSILEATKEMDEEKKNKFVAIVTGSVLATLNPPGRSGLYTQKQEEQLKNTVENINPEKDLYKDLGVSKQASQAAVAEAYEKKSQQLAKDKSPDAQEKLKQISYAKEVLSKDDTKNRYDQKGVEPTIFTKIYPSGILYVQFKKFSPTSYDEFIKAFENYKEDLSLTSLVLDLRGNIGGAIDATPYFLGHFIGKNNVAYDFYHKGEFLPFKTPTDKLLSITRYKQAVILIDNQTQSSAEMLAASLKKYHVGILVGVNTKGWGTVEKVFPLDNQFDKTNKYSLFLVHSITLRDDNQPIEGRGVKPDVNIKNNNWDSQLLLYFNNPFLTQTVKTLVSS